MLKKHGFTLVELLVVIGIIGILTAMILPAVQASRESARLTQCLNNQRQLGIAAQQYHAVKKTFPTGAVSRPDPTAPTSYHAFARWSTLALLMPHMEQTGIYNSLQLELPLYGTDLQVKAVHRDKVSVLIGEFLCPSDTREAVADNFGPTNYAACTGAGENGGSPSDSEGIFGLNSQIKDSHVRDGLSKTALFSESTLGIGPASLADASVAKAEGDYVFVFMTPLNENACRTTPRWNFTSRRGFSWANGEFRTTMYNHYQVPNSTEFDCIANKLDGDYTQRYAVFGWRAARSLHRGVVGLVMADTSTRTVPDTIDLSVWQAWSTRRGGETVPAE